MTVPQFENLTVKDIIAKAGQFPECELYFPESKDYHKLPRQWIINTIYTLVGEPFAKWVQKRVDVRHRKMQIARKTIVKVDARVAAAIKASKQISGKYPLIHLILRI